MSPRFRYAHDWSSGKTDWSWIDGKKVSIEGRTLASDNLAGNEGYDADPMDSGLGPHSGLREGRCDDSEVSRAFWMLERMTADTM